MEFKGTKGKWTLNWDGSSGFQNMLQIVNSENIEVCNFGHDNDYYPTEGTEPNQYDALLISKAPEMLEMLGKWSILNEDKYPELKGFILRTRQLIKEATEL